MSSINPDAIHIYKDELQEYDILKDIITTYKQEDAFYVLDLGIIMKKHQDWIEKMPRIVPYYDLMLYGFSFHVGSPCKEFDAYIRGIEVCKELITFAKSIRCEDIKLIDIGGGFPGESEYQIDELSYIINDAIKEIDPTIEIISEPGRYYVTAAFTLAGYLHSKRTVSNGNSLKQMYYVNCGVYSGFIEELLNLNSRQPISLFKVNLLQPVSNKEYLSTIWGPTCDSCDCIVKDVLLPEFYIGDWLVWKDMGAYTTSRVCEFNGFLPPIVHSFIRKSQWKDFCAITRCDINN
uniref:Ornithine decarboxylase n=1 Tax=Vespula pensylvanica TaxID=30213 RepID=A0A834JFT7_VESPE|nr:hypothetical protein H0235_018403 [Vespula pensylvanica]